MWSKCLPWVTGTVLALILSGSALAEDGDEVDDLMTLADEDAPDLDETDTSPDADTDHLPVYCQFYGFPPSPSCVV